ncbi:MAG: di-heme enzyme [Marinagarivorans sp.]|nr:di-heme enzyme [Marinagarivorans sp.]
MKKTSAIALLIIACAIICGCMDQSETRVETTATEQDLRTLLKVPPHFALPPIPAYNIPTAAKIDLGRHLFYDKQLSGNGTQSCADCHLQSLAFSDGLKTPTGSTGQILARNSQGLGNAAYHATLTWANNGFIDLEQQLQVPIRADNPIELGVTETTIDDVLLRFNTSPLYIEKFDKAFPEANNDINKNINNGVSINQIIHALASFCRTLTSGNSAYDDYLQGDKNALTEQQKLGLQLFNGEKFECFHCHAGINFSSSYRDNNSQPATQTYPFFNNGLYNISLNGSAGNYPAIDQGLFDLSQNPADKGLFRPQSLRNVALTAPYMHDGSIATLREVLEHYARGGRKINAGPNTGDGKLNPYKSGFIQGFDATPEELDAVEAFLESLTDYPLITDPDLADPFEM